MNTSYRTGQTVKWKWGNGTAEGKVEKVAHEKTEIQTKGTKQSRNGTADNPAIVIEQADGTKVIKLANELE